MEDQKVYTDDKQFAESKADKFKRLGNGRLRKAMKAIDNLVPLSNTYAYEYTPEQVEKLLDKLDESVDKVRAAFSGSGEAEDNGGDIL